MNDELDYDSYDYDEPDYDSYDYDDEDEPDDQVYLDDNDFVNGATHSFPFLLEIPADLNNLLALDKAGGVGDSDGGYKAKMWSKVWPNVTPDLIDPAQAAADYYLLFALTNNSFVEFEPMEYPSAEDIQLAGEILEADQSVIEAQKLLAEDKKVNDPRFKLTQLGAQADSKYRNLVYKLDSCFREYVHLACGGELRHHQSCNESLGAYRRGAWVKWFYIYEQNGPEALLTMADLFEEFSGSSYGGPPWANAARILYQREMGTLGPDEFTTKELYVDRVFTLEHNGGCFLNKLDWVNLRKGREPIHSRHFAEMKDTVLNAHASNPTNIDMLLGYASQEVIDLTLQYLNVANDFNIDIVGTWSGKKSAKFEHQPYSDGVIEDASCTPATVAVSESQNKTDGVIDWSDMETNIAFQTTQNSDILKSLEEVLFKESKSIDDGLGDSFSQFPTISWSALKSKHDVAAQ